MKENENNNKYLKEKIDRNKPIEMFWNNKIMFVHSKQKQSNSS